MLCREYRDVLLPVTAADQVQPTTLSGPPGTATVKSPGAVAVAVPAPESTVAVAVPAPGCTATVKSPGDLAGAVAAPESASPGTARRQRDEVGEGAAGAAAGGKRARMQGKGAGASGLRASPRAGGSASLNGGVSAPAMGGGAARPEARSPTSDTDSQTGELEIDEGQETGEERKPGEPSDPEQIEPLRESVCLLLEASQQAGQEASERAGPAARLPKVFTP